ncbi:MAG TPA: type II toxin-antitoxin system RelE/ParE family toxin, partial [Candidatus Tectomicrobia bacterium]
MAHVRWSNQALADLEALGDFIARDAPSVEQVFVERVFMDKKLEEQYLEQFIRAYPQFPEG